ncbi:hypothetical protein HDU87_001427 [Geranomyces variabilis]|uniref:B3/B4 tRNA-binding domain-containing protein n=1 Tax=Geranomyces variabilis TaxID=109894 RepID=A0AAD5XJ16_9FUNG|nr:hypothetical protein HDU87_001427 [Geranomyces variabilis]
MATRRIIVEGPVFDRFPVFRLGCLHGRLSCARPTADAALQSLKDDSLASLLAAFASASDLASDPRIANWKDAYTTLGIKVKKHKPTHWALSLRLLKDKAWPRPIGPLVDVYLTNQIKTLLPHGGYDTGTLAGDLRLRVSPGGEEFEPLGGGTEATDAGELIYSDDARVLTRMWNYRDSDATKIVDKAAGGKDGESQPDGTTTTDFLLFVEDVGPDAEAGVARLNAAMQSLAEAYLQVYEGRFDSKVFHFDKDHREAELP